MPEPTIIIVFDINVNYKNIETLTDNAFQAPNNS